MGITEQHEPLASGSGWDSLPDVAKRWFTNRLGPFFPEEDITLTRWSQWSKNSIDCVFHKRGVGDAPGSVYLPSVNNVREEEYVLNFVPQHTDINGGTSLAYARPSDGFTVGKFGTPYRSDLGALVHWCIECGTPLTSWWKWHDRGVQNWEEFFNIQFDRMSDWSSHPNAPHRRRNCGEGKHRPALIWTPKTLACADACLDVEATNKLRAEIGLEGIDPFESDMRELDGSLMFPLSAMPDWLDSAVEGEQFYGELKFMLESIEED